MSPKLFFFTLLLTLPAVGAEQSAFARMHQPGSEQSALAARAGIWDVIDTAWESPGAAPVVTRMIAERTMIGAFMQEVIKPRLETPMKDANRIDYLSFNRVEGRWKYVSMDMRAPVGLMPAASFGRGDKATISLVFEPFAVPGDGAMVSGQMLRMEQRIVFTDPDHDLKEQRFTMADGTGAGWLAHRYSYTRRK